MGSKARQHLRTHLRTIVHLIQGNDKLHFFYDASNKPAIVDFNDTKYGYVQNLQGDAR